LISRNKLTINSRYMANRVVHSISMPLNFFGMRKANRFRTIIKNDKEYHASTPRFQDWLFLILSYFGREITGNHTLPETGETGQRTPALFFVIILQE
jgi:hypothetical protein